MPNSSDDESEIESSFNPNDPAFTWVLLECWKALYDGFEHGGDLNDISEAISILRIVVERTPEGDADLAPRLGNLGNSFTSRFEHTGNPTDLAEAISLQTKALNLTPEGDANLPHGLAGLGSSYLRRFERTGDLGDIAESISLHTHAVSLTPEGDTDLPGRLTNLGAPYISRFERTVNLLDINEAISVRFRAVDLAPIGHADRPSYLNNLGMSFMFRFRLTHDPWDISKAISAQAQAVEHTPPSHAGLPLILSNLANSILCRFQHFGDFSDVTQAIAALTRAVGLAPKGHAGLPAWHFNLGNAYSECFTHTRNTHDVMQAIYNLREAVHLTPKMHTNLPMTLTGLARAWETYYMSTRHQGHLNEAISNFKYAATCMYGGPKVRLRGAMQWARLCCHYPDWESSEVLDGFETTLNLLMLVAGLEETVQHRYAIIEEYGGLPLEAAAIGFQLGAHNKVLEWLEQGRCVVWGQHSGLRTPLDELKAHNEGLVNRVMEVSRLLEGLGSSRQHSSTDTSLAGKVTLEDEALKHSQLATEWDRLLEHVRVIPGFNNFLRPLGCAAILEHLPRSGPVVVLNVHESRCDAIVLRAGSDELQHVPLPDFTLEKAKLYRRMLGIQLRCHGLRDQSLYLTAEHGTGRTAGQYKSRAEDVLTVNSILKSLWDQVVKPILNVLEFSKGHDNAIQLLPRIWWCPTGPLSFLPIHAAGVYRGEGAENIADYAVSSYTPTVTALAERVKNNSPIDERSSGLFLTCQPEVPHFGAILGTKGEVREIHKGTMEQGVKSLSLEGDAVTPERCLEYMERYSSIHLACHGFQDISDPLQSRFLFNKGPLPLSSIMQKNLPNADLAYLSACQTSTGQETLANEVVHLAAGMLAAGYRRVVLTMWEIGDKDAPQVASDFYGYLWRNRPEGSGSRFDGSLSAYALHYAVQELRGRHDTTDRSLLAWMPFVHYGY